MALSQSHATVGTATDTDHMMEVSLAVLSATASAATAQKALVVDLDGTLLRSDLLVESFFALLSSRPLRAVQALATLTDGKAALKRRLAEEADLDIASLPWNQELLSLLRAERANGRLIYLASASDRHWVDKIAAELGLFDGVFASDGVVNLSGKAKADALCQAFGEGGFDYAGNEAVDCAVWEKAANVLLVNAGPSLVRTVQQRWPTARIIGDGSIRLKDYVRAIRVHQWLKNLLLPLPTLAAHEFDVVRLFTCALAFVAFCCCASSVYVLNDLVDLGRDRAHPTKRRRPFASGTVPVLHGLLMVPVLLLSALILGAAVGPNFLIVLSGYYALTLAYSLWLKRQMMIDVVVLACLYGIRLVAGGVAAGVPVSAWLAAFSLFLFCSLALLKRCTELIARMAKGPGDPAGRDYQQRDLAMLEALAAASGFTAIQVFALYLNSDAVKALYHSPARLSMLCVIMVYWIGRVLMLAHRGEMHDDPVVFAATDRTSLVCVAVAAGVVAASL